jgi:hypothetical protein
MGLGQYGQLVGLFAREAGFDAVENEVEAEFVRPRLTTSSRLRAERSRRGRRSRRTSGGHLAA